MSSANDAACNRTWLSQRLISHPALAPYDHLLQQLPADHFPTAADLQKLLPDACRNTRGQPIQLVSSESLGEMSGDGAYEQQIARRGRVSTRPGSLHDLCNALVWARFPRLKATLNQRHIESLSHSKPGRRGPVRDALTLFDECGMAVCSTDAAPLKALAAHDWNRLFGAQGERWPASVSLWMIGHGNLEQLDQPYPGLIAQCLLLQTRETISDVTALDELLAVLWRQAEGPSSPADLCAFPFAGVPGWWHARQDHGFYANQEVFRPPRPGRSSPPVWSVTS